MQTALAVLAEVDDRVNLPIILAAVAALAARQGDADRAGRLWGAVEKAADDEPRPTTSAALAEYAPYVEPVHGDVFDRANKRGRALSIDEAVAQLLAGEP